MPTIRTLFLVRHGQTVWNAERRMQGRQNSPLTVLGRRQAEDNGALLAKFGIDAMVASPLGRVRETVDILNKDVPVPPRFDDRLVEWDCGEWSGILHKDLRLRWPQAFAAWEADRFTVRPPGGENYPDLIERARAALVDVIAEDGENIAVVSHGMMGRALLNVLLNLSPKETMAIRQRNDKLIRVHLDPKGSWADHFVGGQGPKSGLPMER